MTALDLSRFCLFAATLLVGLAALASVVVLTTRRSPARRSSAKAAPAIESIDEDDVATHAAATATAVKAAPARTKAATEPAGGGIGVAWFARRLGELALVFLTASIIARMVATGHPPFSNQYEFAAAFAWGSLLTFVIFDWRYRVRILSIIVLPLILCMLVYANLIKSDPSSLPPALQNTLLLTLHVASASVGYGAATIAAGAAIVYLLHPRLKWRALPSRDLLEEISYRAVVVAFPMLTLMNILGAVWAKTAWGRYWGFDPKETASLVTWLVYGAYLHARVVRDWRGNKAAVILLVGFAAIIFTFFGNYFFGGLHSYGNR